MSKTVHTIGNMQRVPLGLGEWLPEENEPRKGKTDPGTWSNLQTVKRAMSESGWPDGFAVTGIDASNDPKLRKKLFASRKKKIDKMTPEQREAHKPYYWDDKGNLIEPTVYITDGNGRGTIVHEVNLILLEKYPDAVIDSIPVIFMPPTDQTMVGAVQTAENLYQENLGHGHSATSVYRTLHFAEQLYKGELSKFPCKLSAKDAGKTIEIAGRQYCPSQILGAKRDALRYILSINNALTGRGSPTILERIYQCEDRTTEGKWVYDSPKAAAIAYTEGKIPINTGSLNIANASGWGPIWRMVCREVPLKDGEQAIDSVDGVMEYLVKKYPTTKIKPVTVEKMGDVLDGVVQVAPALREFVAKVKKGEDFPKEEAERMQTALTNAALVETLLDMQARAKKLDKEKEFYDHCQAFFKKK